MLFNQRSFDRAVDVTGEDWPDCDVPFGDQDRRAQGCPPQRSAPTRPRHPFSSIHRSGKVGQLGAFTATSLAVPTSQAAR